MSEIVGVTQTNVYLTRKSGKSSNEQLFVVL